MNLTLTEEQWLSWDSDPQTLIEFVSPVSPRKLRLFYCACVRRLWSLVKDERSRAAVEASERFADGLLSCEQLLEARKAGYSAWYEVSGVLHSAEDHVAAAAFMCANEELVYASGVPRRVAAGSENETSEYREHAALFRDVVGNPFHTLVARNLSLGNERSNIVTLAQAIYDERAFSRLPALAHTLLAAGCDDADILSHCRGPGPHVRACWVVDLILGKK